MGAPFWGPELSQPRMLLIHSCLQHSAALVMDSHHLTGRAGRGHQGKLNTPQHLGWSTQPALPEWHAALRCVASPTITHCPAVTPELCFLQAQSSLRHEPSLTKVMCRHYREQLYQQAQSAHVRKATQAAGWCHAGATADPTCDSWECHKQVWAPWLL